MCPLLDLHAHTHIHTHPFLYHLNLWHTCCIYYLPMILSKDIIQVNKIYHLLISVSYCLKWVIFKAHQSLTNQQEEKLPSTETTLLMESPKDPLSATFVLGSVLYLIDPQILHWVS